MTSVPTSEIERAAAVLGPHATLRTVATAVGMETSALKQRCVEEGIRILATTEHHAPAAARWPSDRDVGSTSNA